MRSISPLFNPLGGCFFSGGAPLMLLNRGAPLLFREHYFTVEKNIQAQCKTECFNDLNPFVKLFYFFDSILLRCTYHQVSHHQCYRGWQLIRRWLRSLQASCLTFENNESHVSHKWWVAKDWNAKTLSVNTTVCVKWPHYSYSMLYVT